jgi:hypothetical protein
MSFFMRPPGGIRQQRVGQPGQSLQRHLQPGRPVGGFVAKLISGFFEHEQLEQGISAHLGAGRRVRPVGLQEGP